MKEEYESIEELNEALQKRMEEENTKPREEFDNLSSIDMYNILYRLFELESPIQYANKVTINELNKIPFYKLFREYLKSINNKGELKLTAKGNLPRNLCKELYGLGIIKEHIFESGISKLNKESDSVVLQNLKIIGDLSGITKKRNNKLSLTKNGKKLYELGQEFELFKKIFETNVLKFNIAYHDGYDDRFQIQAVIGYTLYLLLRYGDKEREIEFYVNKNLKAFPQLLDEFSGSWGTPEKQYRSCYEIRVFKRFLNYYGFTETDEEGIIGSFEKKVKVKAKGVFREILKIEKSHFRFRKFKHDA